MEPLLEWDHLKLLPFVMEWFDRATASSLCQDGEKAVVDTLKLDCMYQFARHSPLMFVQDANGGGIMQRERTIFRHLGTMLGKFVPTSARTNVPRKRKFGEMSVAEVESMSWADFGRACVQPFGMSWTEIGAGIAEVGSVILTELGRRWGRSG